jgi:hypothetical protein
LHLILAHFRLSPKHNGGVTDSAGEVQMPYTILTSIFML